ncbi:uncharacterized protein LOC126669267 [Mercurialis annua]|uniref:uncharacterized protein LOC126669267 n=1 Tax=Mercurialis annua TaxID=3986 RepID=UPI0021603CB2|nr:uncharacterized protein LOC126669267 [Mercurialis annua]
MDLSQNPNLLIGKNYDTTLAQSVSQVSSEILNKTLNLPHFLNLFYQLMQSRIDPPLETIWVYSALSFKTKKTNLSDQILNANELFQLISACSGPCSSSKGIALLAPVVFQVYNLVLELLTKDSGDKKVKKEIKKVKCLIGEILGYISVCCSKDMSESDLDFSASFSNLVSVWMDGNEDVKVFLPLVSDEMCEEISVGGLNVSYLAGVVICEIFLLRLCLDFWVGIRGVEFEKEVKTWIVGSLTGFQNLYFFETLVRMLMEPTLPVTALLSSEDESLMRKIVCDAVILVEYSFLRLERAINLPEHFVRRLAVKRLIITHEAIELSRKNGDHKRALSYNNSFSTSRLRSLIIKSVTSRIGVEEEGNRLKEGSPKALIKWLLDQECEGLRIFDDRISRLHAKLAVDDFKSDSEQRLSEPEGKKPDADLLFYVDNEGEGKEEEEDDDDGDDEETNESMSAAFVAAAATMRLAEKGGRKRKEISAGKNKKIKVRRHDSDSDGENSSSLDGSSSESEVENPSSDGDA